MTLTGEESNLVQTVRLFVDWEVKPTVRDVEGTNEIQRDVIAAQLVARGGI